MKAGVLETLKGQSATPGYRALLKGLIVQGLIKIEEQTVEIQAKEKEKDLVRSVVSNLK